MNFDESHAVHVLEAAHHGDVPLQAWLDHLLAATRGVLHEADLAVAAIVRRQESHWELVLGDSHAYGVAPLSSFGELLPQVDPRALDAYYRNPRHVYTHGTVREAIPEAREVGDGFLAALGMTDSLSLLGQAGDGSSIVLFGMRAGPITVSPRGRLLLTRIAAHLEVAYRVRAHDAEPVAVLGPDGRVRDAARPAEPAHVRERLGRQVKAVEKSRTRRGRSRHDALDAWSALVSGRFGLVEHTSDGRREYHVYENPTHVWSARALSMKEANVLELSARGMSGKLVAYTLGISFASVSEALAAAAHKTGCGSRAEIVRLASRALGIADSGEAPSSLSRAEQEILDGLRQGWSNAAIAKARGTSKSTVANQVGTMLRKFGSPSRRALVASLGDR